MGHCLVDHHSELQSTILWQWILTVDKYGLSEVAERCIRTREDVTELMQSCPLQQLHELSGATVQQMIVTISGSMYGKSYCKH